MKNRLDNHGYVSHTARTINATKNAVQLRDSFILARSVNVAQRQSIFKEPDQQIPGNFTNMVSNVQKTPIVEVDEIEPEKWHKNGSVETLT